MPTPIKKRTSQIAAHDGSGSPRKTNAANQPQSSESGSAAATSAVPSAATAQPFVKLVEQIRQNAKDKLNSLLANFLKTASPEDVRVLGDVMGRWENYVSPIAKGPLDLEIPILSAFQLEINEHCLVEVPEEDMVNDVEKCIAELERRKYDRKNRVTKTADERRDAIEKLALGEMDLFLRHAGEPSVTLMRSILARWNDMKRDPAIAKACDENEIINLLAVVIEIEASNYRATEAAESAIGA